MRKPARVLWLVDSLAADAGTERQIVNLGSRLNREKFHVQLATLETSSRDAGIAGKIELLNFPLPGRLLSPSGFLRLFRIAAYIRRHRIQIVQGFMFKSSLVAALLGVLCRGTVILSSRRNLGYYYTPAILFAMRLLNRYVTRVVANSEAAKQVAVEREVVSADKVDVLYNGVDMEVFQCAGHSGGEGAVALPEGKRIVGMVANYRPVKDIPLFLDAAALVARQIPDAVFLLVGSGSLQPGLEDQARRLDIADRVIFTAGRGQVQWYLQHMHIGCLSSLSEGFSNSILEYMAAGLPVVASDVGGNAEAIDEVQTGFLVRDRAPESFAAPILRLLRDEPLRVRMGGNGHAACRARFSMDTAVQELEAYYQALLETGAPPRRSGPRPKQAVLSG